MFKTECPRIRRLAIISTVGAITAIGTGSAIATTVYEGSNKAYTPTINGSYAQACDGESDGRSVYANYTRNDNVNRRVEVFTGNGHCQNSDTSEANPVYRVMACENVSALPDPCSQWQYRVQ